MPSLFSRIRGKDGSKLKSKKNSNLNDLTHQLSNKPRWEDAYTRTNIEPEEVQELIKICTEELKARGIFYPSSHDIRIIIFIHVHFHIHIHIHAW